MQVYANDLNPESVHYMRKNVELNRIRKNTHVFNMDGRAFVRLLLASKEGNSQSLPQGDAATSSGRGNKGT
jgi:tRNA (guanine37-N1)-methyltransferase